MLLFSVASAITHGTPAEDLDEVVFIGSAGTWCTGTVIHPRIVLTEAHCFDPLFGGTTFEGDQFVVVGAEPSGAPRLDVASVVLHPDYTVTETPERRVLTNDVALLWLVDPLPIPPVALNDTPLDPSWMGLSLEIAGFATSPRARGITRIQAVEPDHILTSGGVSTTCGGDGGGPGWRFQGDDFVQVSVISTHDCWGPPGTQSRVDAYLPWIEATIAPDTITRASLELPAVSCASAPAGEDGAVTLDCVAEPPATDPLLAVDWSWGDGAAESTEGPQASHTWTEPGSWTVSACLTTRHRGQPFVTCLDDVATVTVVLPELEEGCGCRATGGLSGAWAVPLLFVFRRRT